MKLNLQPVELRPLVEKVLFDLKPPAENKNVELINELPEFTANADANRLEQVLANLVDNAIKYGRAQGKVTVGGKKLDDGRLEIFVQDDGPGNPPSRSTACLKGFIAWTRRARATRAARASDFRL